MRVQSLCAILAMLVGARAAVSQGPARRETNIPIPFRTYVAFNPLLVPFDVGSVEIESALASGITVGGAASYTNVDDDRFTSFDLHLRYYPGEVVLRGFSVGLTGGYLQYAKRVEVAAPQGGSADTRVTMNAPTVGVAVNYDWMLGVNRRFLVGTGLGAKRILASRSEREAVGIGRAYMTARGVIGLAF